MKTKENQAPELKAKKLNKGEIATLETKVKSKLKDKQADKATTAAIVKKITSQKELTYKYPEDCSDLLMRKKFRTKARKMLAKLEIELKVANKGKDEKAIKHADKELASFKKETYL